MKSDKFQSKAKVLQDLCLLSDAQEAAQQKRDGSIHDEQMPVMAKVAKFCRARQARNNFV